MKIKSFVYRIEVVNKNASAFTGNFKRKRAKEVLSDPYTCADGLFFNQDEMCTKHSCSLYRTHPSLKRDIPDELFDHYIKFFCACKSITQLKRWFGKYFREMLFDTDEFQVVRYGVEKIVEGKSGRQVFFCPDKIVSRKVIPRDNF